MSDFKSSATLQNSVCAITFPKSTRFSSNRPENGGGLYSFQKVEHSYGPGIGLGNKSDFSQSLNKNNPAPNAYKVLTTTEQGIRDKKGVSIGIRFNNSV